jgi:hypothetical protein
MPVSEEAAMAVSKKGDEFYTRDMATGGETSAGYPA